jgi:hypothetical protein
VVKKFFLMDMSEVILNLFKKSDNNLCSTRDQGEKIIYSYPANDLIGGVRGQNAWVSSMTAYHIIDRILGTAGGFQLAAPDMPLRIDGCSNVLVSLSSLLRQCCAPKAAQSNSSNS